MVLPHRCPLYGGLLGSFTDFSVGLSGFLTYISYCVVWLQTCYIICCKCLLGCDVLLYSLYRSISTNTS